MKDVERHEALETLETAIVIVVASVIVVAVVAPKALAATVGGALSGLGTKLLGIAFGLGGGS